jgi:hypothetical protein
MGLFGNRDDGLMESAIRLCWLSCKFFPSPADITEAIREVQTDISIPDNKRLERSKNYDSPIIAKVMEMMRKGEITKFVAEMSIEPELTDYARSKFPNLSDELIRKNYLEIRQAYEGVDKCFGCMWSFGDCVDKGHFPVMELSASGWISLRWHRCQKGAK